ncbi:hypothetical protein BMS3Abin01_00741 [bacterium BMS3Abin01]|nr:hypothetical protein BMS3Abin01_00741 [bacterium BMS3Abin01]
MCEEHAIGCHCGRSSASLMFRDEIFPEEIVGAVYCPVCSGEREFDGDTMIADNGWLIEYDMEAARFFQGRVPEIAAEMSPGALFDGGYATWRGVYPGDHIDSARERQELLDLARTDKLRYFQEFKQWGLKRMERLRLDGWRKAQTD